MFNLTTSRGPDTTDPRGIDWAARQAIAVVPFEIIDGLPVNPINPQLPAGRGELWHWGEAVAADAIVTVLDPATGRQWLLMVERDDDHGWAVPGGGLEPGDTPRQAAARELKEETGLELPETEFAMLDGRHMPDPREGRHAWMVGFPGLAVLLTDTPPEVFGADDARRAEWVPATSYAELNAAVNELGGEVFAAHRAMLRSMLD